MDDSAGVVGDAASGMLALHAAACRAGPPDPEALARWLIDLELNGPGWPEVEPEAYWDALGPRGQATYRRQVERLWDECPPRPADRPPIYGHDDHRRFVVTRLMEQLAELDQDTDRLIQIIAAQEGGCTDDLWLALAERRAITHPGDAIGVYRHLLEAAVSQGTRATYREAAALAERIRHLHQRAGMW
jgi:hypothetical protein